MRLAVRGCQVSEVGPFDKLRAGSGAPNHLLARLLNEAQEAVGSETGAREDYFEIAGAEGLRYHFAEDLAEVGSYG